MDIERDRERRESTNVLIKILLVIIHHFGKITISSFFSDFFCLLGRNRLVEQKMNKICDLLTGTTV